MNSEVLYEGEHLELRQRRGWEYVEHRVAKESVMVVARTSDDRIVLVEDEALIRMMLVEMVDKMGHIVVAEAGSVAVEPARSCEPAQQSD